MSDFHLNCVNWEGATGGEAEIGESLTTLLSQATFEFLFELTEVSGVLFWEVEGRDGSLVSCLHWLGDGTLPKDSRSQMDGGVAAVEEVGGGRYVIARGEVLCSLAECH